MGPLLAQVVAQLGLRLLAEEVLKRVVVTTLEQLAPRLMDDAQAKDLVKAVAAALEVPVAGQGQPLPPGS